MKKILIILFLLPLACFSQTQQARTPISDDAVTGTWTGSTGTRYTLVDDYPDGSTDNTTCSAVGALTLGISAPSIPSNATITNVQIQYWDQKTASQSCTIGGRVKVNGTYYNYATTHNPSTTATARADIMTNSPATSTTWTVNEVNNITAVGVNVTDASPTINLWSIRFVVTYTVPPARTVRLISKR